MLSNYNYKMIKKLEDKFSELEEKILDEDDIEDIVDGAIRNAMMAEEAELNKIYQVRSDAREEAWEAVTSNIESIVERRLPDLIEKATKNIQDKLIIELARKAMNMEMKNEN